MSVINRKIAVVGVGAVGASVAYALAITGLASELVLVDVNRGKAEGEAMDLAHAAAFIKPVKIYAGDYWDCRDAGIIVFAAGTNQKPGETRLDLLKRNYAILQESLPRLAGSSSFVIMVTNPVDIMTNAALKITGLPPEKVFGTGTVLDSSRFRHSLSSYCRVAPRNVHAYVIGEHGDSEVLVWSKAYIAGVGIDDYCRMAGLPPVNREEVDRKVRYAAYEIISKKGATYYAVSLAVRRICESLIRDENTILTVTGLVDGAYGIGGCCLSLPCVINACGRGRPLALPLSGEEEEALRRSAEILKRAGAEIGL